MPIDIVCLLLTPSLFACGIKEGSGCSFWGQTTNSELFKKPPFFCTK